MPYDLQRSFAAGEISPRYWLRNDKQPMHAAAVKKMRNVIPSPHGPAGARLGFEYIAELEGVTYCRLLSFYIDFDEAFILAITNDTIYVFDQNGSFLTGNLLTNPDFADGSTGWVFDRAEFENGLATLTPGKKNKPAFITQNIIVTPGVTLRLNVFGVGAIGANPFDLKIGTAQGLSDIQYVQNIVGESYQLDFTSITATDIWIEFYVEGEGDDRNFSLITLRSIAALVDSTAVALPIDPPLTDADIKEMQVAQVPGSEAMYLVTRGHEPLEVTYEDHLWEASPIVFDFGETDTTPNEPHWGTDEWPGSITFHDGRLVLGGTYSLPVSFWLSTPNTYTNFDLGDSSLSTDAMELKLSKSGEIVWLQSNTRLFVGLDSGEHVVYGVAGPLAVDDAQTEQHSAYGSSRVQAIVFDEQIIYVDTQGRAVRAMEYSDSQKSFVSLEISFQAEHITAGGIREMSFGISPLGLMWFVTDDGDLVTCSAEKDQGTLGWARHDTQGEVISTCTLKELGIDVPWIAVIRNEKLFIERYSYESRFRMDAAERINSSVLTTHFYGFEHLAGLTVQVLIDDKVSPDLVVSDTGEIVTPFEAYEVVAGLKYTPLLETLPIMNDLTSDNTLSYQKQYSDIYMYLLESSVPVVNGYDPFLRSESTGMDLRQDPYTGLIKFGNDTGWDLESTIEVKQELPLGLFIAALGGNLKENNR